MAPGIQALKSALMPNTLVLDLPIQ